jgi:imidazolonepropionase-like amidohydrolase
MHMAFTQPGVGDPNELGLGPQVLDIARAGEAHAGADDPPDTPTGKRDRARVALHEVSFKKAMKAGVKIAFGTDVGGSSAPATSA